jgi:hypothetical protein
MLRKAYTRTLLGFIIIRIRYSSFLSPDPFLLSVSLRRDINITFAHSFIHLNLPPAGQRIINLDLPLSAAVHEEL